MQAWHSAVIAMPMQTFDAHCALQSAPTSQAQVCMILGMTLSFPLLKVVSQQVVQAAPAIPTQLRIPGSVITPPYGGKCIVVAAALVPFVAESPRATHAPASRKATVATLGATTLAAS